MKKLVFSLLIGVALVSCSEPMNENDNVIKVDIEDARPMEFAIKNNIFYNLVWPENLENYIYTELMDAES